MIGTLHRHDGLVTMVTTNSQLQPPPQSMSTTPQSQSNVPSSSLSSSSSCSSSSYSIINQEGKLLRGGCGEKEHDSGIEKDSSGLNDTSSVAASNKNNSGCSSIFIRVSINDQSVQKVLKFSLDETVWSAKHRLLSTLAKEIKDGLNYGFYLPPYQGRAGKFLDDSRLLREYPLNGQIVNLEFKYKKRVYKFVKINQKELKALNVKSNYKKFLDLVRTNQVSKVEALLRKGLDPNFHSDLGETPLTIAASLAEPRDMIMALCEGGAHLDFRSRDSLTPMHKSAIIGNEKAIKCLLDMGSFADLKCSRMLTPLYYAVMNGSSVQCIEHLLFNGSPVGTRDENNWHEIHYACKLGMAQHLDHLLYYGADINARNNSGNTPLHVCAIHAQESCARILLFRGCNKHERNLANQTALDSAVLAGSHVISELIQTHGDCDVVPIKDRPFYNTKRRSVYIGHDQQVNNGKQCYDDAASSSGGSSSSCVGSTATRSRSMSKLEDLNAATAAAAASASANFYGIHAPNTIIGISNILNGSQGNAPVASNRHSVYNQPNHHHHQMMMNGSPSISSNSMRLMSSSVSSSRHSTVLGPAVHCMNQHLASNSGSSSPISRSRSISSDEHGGLGAGGSLSGLVLSTVHHHHHHHTNNNNNINPAHQYTYQRQRLYPSIPNRTFICVKPHKPAQAGELELQLGDIIELLSVGDSGYWEGRICAVTSGHDTNSISSKGAQVGAEGWLKASCVEEFCLPKDVATADDSIVVKRKTLIDLLTHNDSNAPRTVVLQKGKKGFGFVLRGAKTNENKFEPTPEWPALQFLESVDKESNADKAGLKPLDFVLEINNVDVTCKTHFDCVKLIKKCGDTLVLKVYTPKKSLTNNFASSTTTNFNAYCTNTLASSTSTLHHHNNRHLAQQQQQHYHSPSNMSYRMSVVAGAATMSRASMVNHNSSSSPASSSSSSYYASSNIAAMIADNHSDYHHHHHHHSDQQQQQIYMDGTRTLPNKKNKPVPPRRDPNTSLTPSVAKSLKKLIAASNDNNNYDGDYEVYLPAQEDRVQLQYKLTSATKKNSDNSSAGLMSRLLPSKLLSRSSSSLGSSSSSEKKSKSPVKKPAACQCACKEKASNSATATGHVYSDNSGSYMSSALAQIDELDKTIAEYDSNNSNSNNDRSTNNNEKPGFSTTATALLISKTKLIADDANAASIRTRVPVRKPGINNGEIFNQQQQLLISQKTMSVPNLLQQQQHHLHHPQQCPPSPPLPPPPPPLPPQSQIPNLSTVMISQSISQQQVTSGEFIRESVISTTQHFDIMAATNDESADNVDTPATVYEPAHDYDVEVEETRCGDDDQDPITHSEENSTVLSSNSSVSVGSKNVLLPIGSSPLTPRQIKQRNTAKRNSTMPKTNGSLLMNSNQMSSCVEETGNSSSNSSSEDDNNNNKLYTSTQLRDLEFLQSQQFDSEFIRTTGELFVRYPSAKISISVVSTNSSNEQEKTTRQVEIDKNMFDKICAFHNEMTATVPPPPPPPPTQPVSAPSKIQPPTPARTTSIPSSSVEQKKVDTNDKQQQQHKPGSHVDHLKQQFNQSSSSGPVCVKSELERAIENRMRRTSQLNLQQQSNSDSISEHANSSTNKRNLPRDPPPPPPQLVDAAPSSFPPPPSPKQLRRLNNSSSVPASTIVTTTTTTTSQKVPPPAPPLPASFNNIKPSTTTIYQSSKNTTTSVSNSGSSNAVTSNAQSSSDCGVNKVKTIVNSLQQQPSQAVINDPRLSSDFGALIAKKAAEKRAKFQEVKTPVSNAVTFQPDGSKLFAAAAASQPTTSRMTVESNEKISTDCSIENNPNNESFISTASKLLERVKLQQQKQQQTSSEKGFVMIKQQ